MSKETTIKFLEDLLLEHNEHECSCDVVDYPDGSGGKPAPCYFHRVEDLIRRKIEHVRKEGT